jgi:hypothetical protein
MTWRSPGEIPESDSETRNLYSVRLAEESDRVAGAKGRLVRGLTILVGMLIRQLKKVLPEKPVDILAEAGQDATALLVAAFAGKLESASRECRAQGYADPRSL